jgi:hypothetical protein
MRDKHLCTKLLNKIGLGLLWRVKIFRWAGAGVDLRGVFNLHLFKLFLVRLDFKWSPPFQATNRQPWASDRAEAQSGFFSYKTGPIQSRGLSLTGADFCLNFEPIKKQDGRFIFFGTQPQKANLIICYFFLMKMWPIYSCSKNILLFLSTPYTLLVFIVDEQLWELNRLFNLPWLGAKRFFWRFQCVNAS